MGSTADVIVCGAGLSGLAAAWGLSRAGLKVAVVDDPIPATRDPFAEPGHYSAWWPVPDPAVLQFASRGIDLLEAISDQSDGALSVSRRGELIVATSIDLLDDLRIEAARASAVAGPVREHESADLFLPSHPVGFRGVPGGFDWFGSGAALRATFPFIGAPVLGGLVVRRAGWVDGAALRRWLFGALRAEGTQLIDSTVVGLEEQGTARTVRLSSGVRLTAGAVVVASNSRMRGWIRRSTPDYPLVDLVRVVTRVSTRRFDPSRTPDLLIAPERHSLDMIRIGPGPAGSAILTWTIDEAAAAEVTQSIRYLADRLRSVLPDLEPPFLESSDFASSTTRLPVAPDRRPLVGMIDRGLLVSAGHGDSLTFVLAAGELLASYVLGQGLPVYAPSLAPSRVPGLAPLVREGSVSPRM